MAVLRAILSFMDTPANDQANSGGEIKPLSRRPGPAKGTPRPSGSGRKPGTPNRITKDVREAAQKHGSKALKKLVDLMSDKDPRVSLAATREILDRAYGRPVSPQEISGKDGAPLLPPTDERESAKAIAYVLSKAAKDAGVYRMGKASDPAPSPPTATPGPSPAPAEPVEDDPAHSRWHEAQALASARRDERADLAPRTPNVVRLRPDR